MFAGLRRGASKVRVYVDSATTSPDLSESEDGVITPLRRNSGSRAPSRRGSADTIASMALTEMSRDEMSEMAAQEVDQTIMQLEEELDSGGLDHTHTLEQALACFDKETQREDWASTCFALGWAYRATGDEDDDQRAELMFRHALDCFDEKLHPGEWALGHYALADQLHARAIREGVHTLQGQDCFDGPEEHYVAALRVFKPNKGPFALEWARSHKALGSILGVRGAPDLAAEHFEQALRVFTRSQHPAEWAACNLGLGQMTEDTEKAAKHLVKALRVYDSACEVIAAADEDEFIDERRMALEELQALRWSPGWTLKASVDSYSE